MPAALNLSEMKWEELAMSENYYNIEAIFNAKWNENNSLGYFSQIYEPSIMIRFSIQFYKQ